MLIFFTHLVHTLDFFIDICYAKLTYYQNIIIGSHCHENRGNLYLKKETNYDTVKELVAEKTREEKILSCLFCFKVR